VKRFKKRFVVRGVTIELHPGEVVGLLGPNGAGKTTTFKMVVGLLKPTSGAVWFDGRDVTRLPMYRRARLGISYLPQEPSVFRHLTVRKNLLAILEHRDGVSKQRRDDVVEELLEDFGIVHLGDNLAQTLSGGERRRCEIARALVTNPKILLLDEPFAGIDPIAVADLQETVLKLKDRGIGVLITDHNVRETLQTVDRAYILNEGALLVSGTPQEIVTSPVARKVYLGDRFKTSLQPSDVSPASRAREAAEGNL